MLAGRGALVTGGSQGFGLEIARAFVRDGADVFICARDGAELERARVELVALASPGQHIGAHVADVAREQDVLELVTAVAEVLPRFSVLVNNAGVYGPKGQLADVEWDEWLHAIAVNLGGSALVARAAFPHFLRAGYGKVIQLSGGGATAPLPGLSAYAASKAAVVRLAETLALEWRPHKIDVNALAPGALNTRLLDEVIEAGPQRVGSALHERALRQRAEGGASMVDAAACVVWLASSQSDGITGKLLSAVWDPWRELPSHAADLDSDVYTLRRIVPADRGLDWGDPPAG
jgi:NAD(P)-dependent dehydrogenase (short-subunit alcohol dehydrogenase family)